MRPRILTAGGVPIAASEIEHIFDGFPGVTDCAALVIQPDPETTILALAYCATASEAQFTQHTSTLITRHNQPRAFCARGSCPVAQWQT